MRNNIQEKYPNHILLDAKMFGETKALKGNVVVIVFYINDTVSTWNDSAKKVYRNTHEAAMKKLKNAAKKAGVSLTLRNAFGELTLPIDCTVSNWTEWSVAAVQKYNRQKISEYQVYYKQKFGCTEAPVLFAFNRHFRSYTLAADAKHPYSNEFSAVSMDSSEKTIIHELLHQFGAPDYYYPKIVKNLADKYLPQSIMASGNGITIDSLTSYLIGWTDSIDRNAETILEQTKHITYADIDKELKEIWEKENPR